MSNNDSQFAISSDSCPLSPLQTFPFDILAEIFYHYDHSDNRHAYLEKGAERYHHSRKGIAYISNGPWRLGQICHYWREIALSLPPLWSTINLRSRNLFKLDSDSLESNHYEFLINEGLRRSGNAMLVISWDGGMFHMLLRFYRPHASRWQRIAFDGGWHEGLRLLMDIKLPSLQSILLRNFDCDSSGYPQLNAPNLSSISFENVIQPLIIPLPWTQITALCDYATGSSFDFDATECCPPPKYLQKCPNLRYLSTEAWGSSKKYERPSQPIYSSFLTSLSIHEPMWLRDLQLPNLRHLFIERVVSDADFSKDDEKIHLEQYLEALLDFILRSSCSLHTLKLHLENTEAFSLSCADILVKTLNLLNELAILHIKFDWGKEGADVFARQLILSDHVAPASRICPNLSDLSLTIFTFGKNPPGLIKFFERTLFSLISSRTMKKRQNTPSESESESALTVFRVDAPRLGSSYLDSELEVNLEMKRKWEMLRDKGVEIWILGQRIA